ncbi:6-phosphofructo-2-kinase/fructose-2,6-bisphosphatase 1 [Zancudomyces culisetae]|uniref:6-phosphofructo-2-kinase/fructose-2, 6-bisphosphatase 1 n=1 Tax=Zancudomyces culisetae TaxID=1213189 RepID=A0A1R1PFD1_ZANCU|nr:6-phosphofructo-2-kinase/fructose-2,6-bisphosphatase 1 [Zancudomyces culisetae]|eukprot:OMH79710.1 6-phosphofructo-2-kinase/fructose-2,6-bisphosphatase 1 [Zancudomyces culisetae]
MNIHTLNRVIYLARCGEEVSGVSLKADPNLSEAGKEYSEKLYASIMKRIKERNRGYEARSDGVILKVWCSSQVKCIQTAEPFLDKDGVVVRRRMMLRGRDEGVVLGMTPNEIKEKYPEEYDKHIIDPYNYSFPRAEVRFIHHISMSSFIVSCCEREENDILIIAPESVLRCVYAYFTPGILPKRVIPTLKFPRSVLVELTPTAYGCIEKKIPITDA